mmetsp:Transcript_35013/g.59443  ORF Transcript_35013/g.59443 Transcript_35013/m.59443 type:complete len:485 (-) Transcript_35013:121-1575(-)
MPETLPASFRIRRLAVGFLLPALLATLHEISYLVHLTAWQSSDAIDLLQFDQPMAFSHKDERVQRLMNVRHRYYIYNSTELHERLPRAPNGTVEMATFAGAVWSIFEALKRHPLRTMDPNEATFFVPPVFVNQIGSFKHALSKEERRNLMDSMDLVTSSPIYQSTLGKRHIFIAMDGMYWCWRAFGGPANLIKIYNPEWLKNATHEWWEDDMPLSYERWTSGKGLPSANIFKNIILARERDVWELHRMSQDGTDYREWEERIIDNNPIPANGFSFGLMDGPGDVELIPASYEKYAGSEWAYFYHTRPEESTANSTIFRHAPVTTVPADGTAESVTYRRSSVGFDIDPAEWARRYSRSRFCLVVRGDNPGSRALLRAVRVGCIPVVISDLYPRYAPSFKSTLDMSEYAVLVEEEAFVVDPWGTLHRVYAGLTETDVKRKLTALAFAQRVIFPDHPDSLFVRAFLREAWASTPESQRAVGCDGGCT